MTDRLIIFAARDYAEWRSILETAGIIFGIVAKMEDIANDAQMLASEALVPFCDGKAMTVKQPDLDQRSGKVQAAAPAVGEHSEEVLRSAGYTDAEIRALRAEGVIG